MEELCAQQREWPVQISWGRYLFPMFKSKKFIPPARGMSRSETEERHHQTYRGGNCPLCYPWTLKTWGHPCPHCLSHCIHHIAKAAHEFNQIPFLGSSLDSVLAPGFCHFGISEYWHPVVGTAHTLQVTHAGHHGLLGCVIPLSLSALTSWLC